MATLKEKKFIKLIQSHEGIIRKVCQMYCMDEEHKKDVSQEILIQLWKSFDSFAGKAKFSSWMYKVALNVAIQDFRKVKKRAIVFAKGHSIVEPKSDSYPISREDEEILLHMAIDRLSKIDKAILLLHFEEKSNAEIGEIMGITPNYVRVKMTRIKQRLKQLINSK